MADETLMIQTKAGSLRSVALDDIYKSFKKSYQKEGCPLDRAIGLIVAMTEWKQRRFVLQDPAGEWILAPPTLVRQELRRLLLLQDAQEENEIEDLPDAENTLFAQDHDALEFLMLQGYETEVRRQEEEDLDALLDNTLAPALTFFMIVGHRQENQNAIFRLLPEDTVEDDSFPDLATLTPFSLEEEEEEQEEEL